MTTINCSSNCKFQKDGRCNLDNFYTLPISSNPDCVYYQPVETKSTISEVNPFRSYTTFN